MSKCYQVLREMPFCKVGDILINNQNDLLNTRTGNITRFIITDAIDLIKEGWIKPVEEEKKTEYYFKIFKKRTDEYNYIGKDGNVKYDRFDDKEIYTEEINEKELAKMKARAKIRRFIEEKKLEKGKYEIMYYYDQNCFDHVYMPNAISSEYRLTEIGIEKLISACSDELKIVFGIE